MKKKQGRIVLMMTLNEVFRNLKNLKYDIILF
jgi:hypothetical protein